MTIPTLSDEQRRHLGTLIWNHIDGVAGNVNSLLTAINRDVRSGVRVVATHEWDRANAALRTLQDLATHLESSTPGLGVDQLLTQLREVAGSAPDRIAPKPARTPIF